MVAGACATGIVTLGAMLSPAAPIAAGGKNAGGKSVACFESIGCRRARSRKFSAGRSTASSSPPGAVDSPIPPSFAVQQVIKIDWKSWGGTRAVGRGAGATPRSAAQPVPVTVTLSKPRKKCGHRAYTKAKFKYQFGIPAEPLNLSTC